MSESGEKKRGKPLSKAQRDEITRRVLAGEMMQRLAEEFGVSRQYVSQLKKQGLDPDFRLRKMTLKLTRAELKTLDEALAGGTPEDYDLIPHRDFWTLDHGFQLAEKVLGRRPSMRAMKEAIAPYLRSRDEFRWEKPKPPKPPHVNHLSPELAVDEDYVKYYLSDICTQIRWKEYEAALKDWEERFEPGEKRAAERDDGEWGDQRPPDYGAPGVRMGKHSKGRAPAKRKKRKKKGRK